MREERIKILIDLDSTGGEKADEIFEDNLFDIDKKSLRTIGDINSADNLTEYDVIALDYYFGNYIYPDRYSQIKNFLAKEGKLLIILLNHYRENVHRASNIMLVGHVINSYGGEADIIDIEKSGKKYKVTTEGKKSFLSEYLDFKNKEWNISLKSETYNFIVPLALNTDDNTVAFSIKHEKVKAQNFFIPSIPNNEKLLWSLIRDYLLKRNKNHKSVDNWIFDYSFKELDSLNEGIKEKENDINKIKQEKILLENKKEKFERIRNTLLNLDGDLLKDVCKEVFKEIGMKTEDGRSGKEDLIFIIDGEHFVSEVKGCINSASKKNISQLRSHITDYEDEKMVQTKGILLLNAWRKSPIEERGTKDKPIYPDDVKKLVNISKNIILITTQQLFVIYCKFLEGKFNLKEFKGKLKSTTGALEGFNDIKSYKIKKLEAPL